MKRLLISMLLLIGLLSAFAVYGHHSAAGVDTSKTVTVEGVVKQFKWQNPHSYLDLEVPNSKGGVDVWSFEMTSPTFLVQAGWKSTTLKAGDKVKVVGRPLKNGDPGGLFVSVTVPDGKTYSQQRQPPAAAPAATPARD